MVIHKGVFENDLLHMERFTWRQTGSRQGKARRLPGSQSKVTETDNSCSIMGATVLIIY